MTLKANFSEEILTIYLEGAIDSVTAPEAEKQIMQMKCLMKMENDEIAQFLDITPDSVRAYISRARGHIRAMLYAD